MQIQLQAISRKSGSLRKAITDDLRRRDHEILLVKEIKNLERRRGCPKSLEEDYQAQSTCLGFKFEHACCSSHC